MGDAVNTPQRDERKSPKEAGGYCRPCPRIGAREPGVEARQWRQPLMNDVDKDPMLNEQELSSTGAFEDNSSLINHA